LLGYIDASIIIIRKYLVKILSTTNCDLVTNAIKAIISFKDQVIIILVTTNS